MTAENIFSHVIEAQELPRLACLVQGMTFHRLEKDKSAAIRGMYRVDAPQFWWQGLSRRQN